MQFLKKKKMERILIDRENVDSLEEDIIIRRGIERYMYVRQFVYGKVLDIACGEGYGSYLMSKNPDVVKITSVDRSEQAIADAIENFSKDNIEFVVGTPETVEGKFDVMVSLETIEHLPEPAVLQSLVSRCDISEIIISFPRKKTTHYNKYHLWDFMKEDMMRLFEEYECYRIYDIHDSTIMNFVKIKRNGYTIPKRYQKI